MKFESPQSQMPPRHSKFTVHHRIALGATLLLALSNLIAFGSNSDEELDTETTAHQQAPAQTPNPISTPSPSTRPQVESVDTFQEYNLPQKKLMEFVEGEWAPENPENDAILRIHKKIAIERVHASFEPGAEVSDLKNGAVFVTYTVSAGLSGDSLDFKFHSTSCDGVPNGISPKIQKTHWRGFDEDDCPSKYCGQRGRNAWMALYDTRPNLEGQSFYASLESDATAVLHIRDFTPACYICDRVSSDNRSCEHYQMVANPRFTAHLDPK